MKNLFILIIVFGSLSCSNKYNTILEGLTNNYVLLNNEIDKDFYLEHFKLTEKQHLYYLKEYNKAVKDFYEADKKILNYLLSYEEDTIHTCKWIKTKDPYSSYLSKTDFLTNAEGALVLFDNYLTNSSGISIPTYINKLSYEKLKLFYAKNKGLSKDELKKEYTKLVQQ